MVKLPALPQMGDFPIWKRRVITEVASASGRGDRGIKWVSAVFDEDATTEKLHKAGDEFESLDVKLLNAVHRIADGNPKGIHLESFIQREISQGRQVNGRQALLLIVKTYGLTGAHGLVYGLTTLMKVEWMGDNEMAKFLATWDKVSLGMGANRPSEQHMEEIFLTQLKKSRVFEQDIRKYVRLEPGHADKTYAKLYKMVQD